VSLNTASRTVSVFSKMTRNKAHVTSDHNLTCRLPQAMHQIVLADRNRKQAALRTVCATHEGLQRPGTNSTTLRRLAMVDVLA